MRELDEICLDIHCDEGPEVAAEFRRGWNKGQAANDAFDRAATAPSRFKVLSAAEFIGEEAVTQLEALKAQTDELASRAIAKALGQPEPDPFAPPERYPIDVPSPFRVIEASEFAGGEYIEPDWQVHELVPKQGSGLDIGESTVWKSFKVFDLAAAIHRGVPYHGRPVQRGRAVIVVAEGRHGYPLRMQAYAKHHGVSLSELPAVIPAAPNLFEPRQIEELIKQLKILGATYVALDTKWRCSLGADENSAKDNAIIFGSIERIAREVGCFCTAISHVGKNVALGVRGSSSQFAAVDVEVTHERVGDFGTSTVSKLKEAESGAVLTVKMRSVELGRSRKTGEAFGSLVVEYVDNAQKPKTQAKQPTGKNQKTVLAVLEERCPNGEKIDIDDLVDAVLEDQGGKVTRGRKRDIKVAAKQLATDGHIWAEGQTYSPKVILKGKLENWLNE
jgi:hypothetical protein